MNRTPALPAVLMILLATTLVGCVRKSTHEVALSDLARARSDHESLEARMRAELEQRDRREAELSGALRDREARISNLETELARTERSLESANAEIGNLQVLLGRRGEEFRALQERLVALGQVEREIRERNRIYEDMVSRFRSLIDGGRLSVDIVRGRMVIQLPQDILFPSGSATLSQDGTRTLREVGSVLAGLEERSFQVEGHTDNVPIATERFPSNWELSSARAMSVIRVLLDSGVSPDHLSGAGYGEYQPVSPNDTPDGRRLNRRIEIVMLPNLDVIAATPVPE